MKDWDSVDYRMVHPAIMLLGIQDNKDGCLLNKLQDADNSRTGIKEALKLMKRKIHPDTCSYSKPKLQLLVLVD